KFRSNQRWPLSGNCNNNCSNPKMHGKGWKRMLRNGSPSSRESRTWQSFVLCACTSYLVLCLVLCSSYFVLRTLFFVLCSWSRPVKVLSLLPTKNKEQSSKYKARKTYKLT